MKKRVENEGDDIEVQVTYELFIGKTMETLT
jgi:hypothetical protein